MQTAKPAAPLTRDADSDSRPASDAQGSDIGFLHGRMLQVSRLATIGEMAAGIAHELNQPLTAIANYAQACERLLGRSDVAIPGVREALREISAQAVRSGEIIHRLRSLAGTEPMRRLPADVNATIEEIRELVEADARNHNATLTLELDAGLPPVSIDVAHIQHVILNLARNAFEAPAGADTVPRQVRIGTRLTPEHDVEISVSDNGPGLTAQALDRMFDPFFSTKPNGTGLGLPISHTVARAHGGTLGHRPSVPRGACFFLLLPAQQAASLGSGDAPAGTTGVVA